MHLILASREDEASMSMAGRLLETVDFRGYPDYDGLLAHGDFLFSYIEVKHLFLENFDQLFGSLSERVSDVIFLSRHSSKADIKSLTVHPTGNFNGALLGGREKRLSMSDPGKMTSTLRAMNQIYSGSTFSVTFEATHHGPLLDMPNFFIEIGTTEAQWKDDEALDTVVQSIMSPVKQGLPSYVGAGGGHYMPKVTRYAIENDVDVGHMISKHALEEISESMLLQSIEKTPNCKGFIVDRKGVKSQAKQLISSISDQFSLETILV